MPTSSWELHLACDRDECGVERTLGDPFDEPWAVVGDLAGAQVRQRHVQCREHQYREAGESAHRDRVGVCGRTAALEHLLKVAQDVSRVLHHLAAGGRGPGTCGVSLEEPHPAPSFQRGQPLAGGRLGNQQFTSRRPHRPMPSDGDNKSKIRHVGRRGTGALRSVGGHRYTL